MKTSGQNPPERIKLAEDGEWLVPVVRGISFNSDTEAEAYALADNRLAELGGWIEDKLAGVLKDLAEMDALDGVGWDEDDVDELLKNIEVPFGEEPEEAPEPQIDRAEELREEWGVERGQIWEIPSKTVEGGVHRVMCGDSYSEEDRVKLFAGSEIKLLVTDPPWGIAVVKQGRIGGDNLFRGKGQVGAKGLVPANWYDPIVGDDKPFDPQPFLDLANVVVLFGANCYADKLPPSRGWIVWDKVHGLEGTTTSFSDAELAWTNQDKPVRIYRQTWHGLVRQEEHDKRWHPTQKPIGLFRWIIEMYTEKGEAVADLFVGSGSCVLAAEQTGRIGYGMEIEPKYVAVTLQRLADMGLEPRKVGP